MRIPPLPAALLLVAAWCSGQTPAPAAPADLARDLLVPIHSQPDDEAGGRYGTWAAGPDYKASFHDGFAFYPYLGAAAPRHLPLHWRTESITVGGFELLSPRPSEHHDDYRFERHSGDVIEAYDVRLDGVEQTFTLRYRPVAAGALVVVGRVTTPLSAAVAEARHGDLVFADAGQAVLCYGRAFAVDAAGRRWNVMTSYDGVRIRLTVPAEVVEVATFPLVVDPLVGSLVLNAGANVGATIVASTGTTNVKVVTAWVRHATSTDDDVYALVTNASFASAAWLYQDITTSWSTPDVDAGYTAYPARWVLGLRRDFSSGNTVRAYVHDAANTTANSGTTLFLASPAGFDQGWPIVGGNMNGLVAGGSMNHSRALLVFQRTHQTSQLTGCWAVRIHVGTPALETVFGFDAGLLAATSGHSVTPLTSGDVGWIVGMTDGSDVLVAKVTYTGSGTVPTTVLATSSGVQATRVAGSNGRYLLAYSRGILNPFGSGQTGNHLVRFDWPEAETTPTVRNTRVLESASWTGVTGVRIAVLGGLAYDQVTRSHWTLSSGIRSTLTGPNTHRIDRLGFSGGTTEVSLLDNHADVAFARPAGEGTFLLADANGAATRAVEFAYPADAISVPYGSSCAPGTTLTSDPPYAGDEFFRTSASGLPAGAPVIYLPGIAPASVDLGTVGFPGCFLNVSLGLGTIATVANSAGTAAVTYALPDSPLFLGDLYSQWFFFDLTLPQPVLATAGMHHQVR